jgi:hypothetical protein
MKPGSYAYFLPTFRMAKAVMWDALVRTHIPAEVIAKKNDSELAIYYKNGSIQRFLGCEDPDTHRGINPVDVVFDEYQNMSPLIWTEIIQPVLRENNGTATFVGTPKGKNHLWTLMQQAKDNPQWFVSLLNVNDTKSHSPEELDETKKLMPEALYNQEFMCSFAEASGAFFRRIHENLWDAPEYHDEGRYRLGVDLARHQDFTVVYPFNLDEMQVGNCERWNQVDWPLTKARIEAFYRRYDAFEAIVDATGVGDPISGDLARAGVRVVPFTFTERSKMDLLSHLAVLLEQDRIKIPNDPGLIEELEGFQYVLGDRGKVKVESVTPHDDRVMALALSVWGTDKAPARYDTKPQNFTPPSWL